MTDWLPTEGMAIGAYVLTLLMILLIHMAYRIDAALKQTAAWRGTMGLSEANKAHKSINEVI